MDMKRWLCEFCVASSAEVKPLDVPWLVDLLGCLLCTTTGYFPIIVSFIKLQITTVGLCTSHLYSFVSFH